MARHVFDDLGYRRYEWKCNALNAPSQPGCIALSALPFEGIFRQHMIASKGRNRRYGVVLHAGLRMAGAERRISERWLDLSNFSADDGKQKIGLSQLNQTQPQPEPKCLLVENFS